VDLKTVSGGTHLFEELMQKGITIAPTITLFALGGIARTNPPPRAARAELRM
jgi:hypothetical protein